MASFEQRAGRFRIVFRYAGQKFNRPIKTTNEKNTRGTLARLEDNLRRLGLGALLLPEAADIVTFLLSDGNVLDPSCHPSARWANYSATILRRSPPMALSQRRFGRGLHQSIRNKPASSPCFSVPAIVAGLPPRDSTHLRIPSWSVVVLETCFMAAVALSKLYFLIALAMTEHCEDGTEECSEAHSGQYGNNRTLLNCFFDGMFGLNGFLFAHRTKIPETRLHLTEDVCASLGN
jgi:hypothetical protein